MNYIHQLKRALAAKDAQLRSMDESFTLFRSYLNGPKFTGTENGERKDWIATADLIAWLQETQSASFIAGENAVVAFNIEHA